MINGTHEELTRRLNDPEYRNWVAVGAALLFLSDSLRKYAEDEMQQYYTSLVTRVGIAGGKCHCLYRYGKKRPFNPHGRRTPCRWAQELKNDHTFLPENDIPWHQSISSQWDDPVHGYWEIAKLFMDELGKNSANVKDPSTTDIGHLLNLFINCNHFKIQRHLLEAVKGWRNEWAHNPDCKFSEVDKEKAIKDIESLIKNDSVLAISKYVLVCLPAIETLETVDCIILPDSLSKVLEEYRCLTDLKERNMTEKLNEVVDKLVKVTDNLRNKAPGEISDEISDESVAEIPDEMSDESVAEIPDEIMEEISDETSDESIEEIVAEIPLEMPFGILDGILVGIADKVFTIFLTVLGIIIYLSPLRNTPRILFIVIIFMLVSQVGDRTAISDGCSNAMLKSPISQFNFQEFNFSSYLSYKRERFVGRKWFFQELETIFMESPEIAGVLITGGPGSGKSALMSQLICSQFSSSLIHDNIIGYHLCDYSEPGKRDGARFVRNLVDQIAARLPEYAEHVMNNEELRKELDERCQKDSIACFFTTIVEPLRKEKRRNHFGFIIIDALDECFESDMKTSEIMDILNNTIIHFPKWLKVVLASRNLTSVTSKLPAAVSRTSLYATDERNIDDFRQYISRFSINQNSDFSDTLTALSIRSATGGLKMLQDGLITRADGNFLFVKTVLEYEKYTDGKADLRSLPTSLFDLYKIFFDRQFGDDGFAPFKPLFEVLLAVYSPLQPQDIEEILKSDYDAANVSKLIGQVSRFLRFGRNGTVRIYHQSFAEWLKDQSHVFSINKTRGHQSIAKFLFRRIRERHANVTFEDLTELFMHILSGRAFEMQETAMDLFNIIEMREPETNQSILHHLVTKPGIYLPVLDFFLQKFETVDVLDAKNRTPAFYAASEGFVQSLQSCINNGADVSSFLEGYTELDPLSIAVRNTGIEEFSLMHQAVAKGRTDLVEFLLKSNVSFPDYSKKYPTPLHLAAGRGYLEIVILFHKYGSTFDQITLHHAAARNHSAVVKFLLLTVGLRDTCVPCEPKHFTELSQKTTIQEVRSYFCETALHAAVSRGLVDIAKVLLATGKEALECKHHSGKTALIDSVMRNDTEMVDILLKHGANVTNECGWRISEDSNMQMRSLYSMNKQDFIYTMYCVNDSCGYGQTALHLSAESGLCNMVEKFISGPGDIVDLGVYSKYYPSPLHLAAGNGRLEAVKLFYNKSTTFDQITLHHAAARNHSAVVKFLLSTVGLRDTCVPCQPEQFSQQRLKIPMQEVHSYFCETALHAAVSRGLVDIVNVLLASGKEALECKHHSGKTVLMDAIERNDTKMVDLLLKHGADVAHAGGWRISEGSNKRIREQICSMYAMYKQNFLYTVYCDVYVDSCECGHTALHLSAKFGLWNMAEKLIGRQVDILDLADCYGNKAIDIAIVYDQANFVQSYSVSLGKMKKYLNEGNIVQVAVTYCSTNVTKLFLNYSLNYMGKEDIWNLLLQSVYWSPCCKLKNNVDSYCLRAFRYSNLSEKEKPKKESERRLNIVKLFIENYEQKYLLFDKKDSIGMTLLHYAASFGFEDVVKYLVEHGSDTLFKDKNGNTPLMIAVKESPINHLNPNSSYRCYTTNDGQFTSCNTTCYDETVRFLIQSQRSSISRCGTKSAFMLKQVIEKRMPLSLYALQKIGVDLNFRFNGFSSTMLLHLYKGGREVGEVLKMFEVDVSLKCGVPFHESELHIMSSLPVFEDLGNFFKPSLNKKRSPLQRLIDRHPRGVHILDECYDAEGYLPVHRAAQGGNLDAIKWFKNIGVNTQLKTRSGLTALDISIMRLRDQENPRYRSQCFEELLRHHIDTTQKNYSSHFSSVPFCNQCILHLAAKIGLGVLTDVYNKALEITPILKKHKFFILDEQDVNGDTPLHIAAREGRDNEVKYLVRLGADINIKNKNGNTPLLTAVRFSSAEIVKLNFSQRCYTTNDTLFTSCNTTSHDEIGRFLISSQKPINSKCDAQSANLLNQVIKKRMPLSLYALLKAGVDINCKENQSMSPFLQHLRTGGQHVSEVFKIFEVNVSVKCGYSFKDSELHLISYLSASNDFGNFFKPSLNKKRFPLQRLIDRHHKSVRILDECYDAEGYLPIHRAAQGGNLDAIKWFKRVGVNTHLKTRGGLTALDISILYLDDAYYGQLIAPAKIYFYLHKSYPDIAVTTSEHRIQVFDELLRTFFDKMPEYRSKFPCGPALEGLSLLHIAAVKGMDVLRYVHKQASEVFWSLPLNCVNKHRLDPVYLAFFYESVRNEGLIRKYSGENSSEADLVFDKAIVRDLEKENEKKTDEKHIEKEFSYGSVPAAIFPNREVDYIMAFHYLYHSQSFETTEEMLLDTGNIRAIFCPRYYDVLPNLKEVVSLDDDDSLYYSECSKIRVRHDYYRSLCRRAVKESYVHSHDCLRKLKRLRSWFTKKRRRNRQLSSFIAERLGWSDSYQDNNIVYRWPFYFLRKKLLKEYEAYEYLNILNEALEVADIRFDSRDLNEFEKDP